MDEKIAQNEKWKKQQVALRKIQLGFEFLPEIDKLLRLEAVERGETPSSVARRILGFDVTTTLRQRVSVSFNDKELESLAKKLEVEMGDRKALVRRATEVIQLHFWDQQKGKKQS